MPGAAHTVDALSRSVRDTVSVALLGNPSFTPGAADDLDLNSSPGLLGIRPSFLLGQKYTLTSDVLKRAIDMEYGSTGMVHVGQGELGPVPQPVIEYNVAGGESSGDG